MAWVPLYKTDMQGRVLTTEEGCLMQIGEQNVESWEERDRRERREREQRERAAKENRAYENAAYFAESTRNAILNDRLRRAGEVANEIAETEDKIGACLQQISDREQWVGEAQDAIDDLRRSGHRVPASFQENIDGVEEELERLEQKVTNFEEKVETLESQLESGPSPFTRSQTCEIFDAVQRDRARMMPSELIRLEDR